MPAVPYIGRFAPSPTGPLHAGSVVAALASWLDAKAHGGQWRLRLEDVDTTRCIPAMSQTLLAQLTTLGLQPDGPVMVQSHRARLYQQALDALLARGLAYPCGCTRQDIERALALRAQPHARHGERVYPGTCRMGLNGKAARAWRLRVTPGALPDDHAAAHPSTTRVNWRDRRLGPQTQDVAAEVGDFVLLRADGCFAYQLAVVVDDGAQGITDVVRGEDLADNTARQILLQRALGLPTPRYLHTPLVRDAHGDKLSKQNGAPAVDTHHPLQALGEAARLLGLPVSAMRSCTPGTRIGDWLAGATAEWAAHWRTGPAKAHTADPSQ